MSRSSEEESVSSTSDLDLEIAPQEESWQDAQSEQPAQAEEKEKSKHFIDEENLRKKIRMIQQDTSLDPKAKAKKIQVRKSQHSHLQNKTIKTT
ncbi:hypothetical protein BY458DRAFT_428146 [Sporodiniella umbellata]|nr:hypothetical protein BY458DRAFT_428146 [Sporodiniella umbellata]